MAAVIQDRGQLAGAARSLIGTNGVAATALAMSVVVPLVSLGLVFWGVEVPLSPHDGAYHTEVSEALRAGERFADWYPPALPAVFAAVLQLLPWVDTARGTYELGLSLALLAPLVVFGIALSLWRNVAMAGASALALSLTYLFPYFPQIWSGWPLAASILLTFGVWTTVLEYIARPSWQWAAVAGVLLGAILIVHGTEVYTLGLVLLVVLAVVWQRLPWRQLPGHLGITAGIALVCAAPYLPIVLHWAGGGGAVLTGDEAGRALASSASSFLEDSTFLVFLGGSLGMDVPIRLILLAIGAFWAVRQWPGRVVVGVAVLFLLIGLTFTLLNSVPIVRTVYSASFPWGMSYRTLIMVVVGQALLAGAGVVVLGGAIRSRWKAQSDGRVSTVRRLAARMGRLLVITWLLLTWAALLYTLSITRVVVGYTEDDAAAMQWFRSNAAPGALVANDSFADAGIWIPYKTGLTIVQPFVVPDPVSQAQRTLLLANIGQLDRVRELACAMNLQYVYSGARVSDWDARRYPTVDELRASPFLEEVFRQGDATIFRVRLNC
jgi:hypothetical protein